MPAGNERTLVGGAAPLGGIAGPPHCGVRGGCAVAPVSASSIVGLLPDRRILEHTIFPYLLNNPECRKILFVGCRWYTRRYNAVFAAKQYSTIDRDPQQRRNGARHHITDSLENLEAHVAPGELDAIICNGVLGWGLDRPAAVERAFSASHHCLRDGGLFIVGWNDTARRRVAFLDECEAVKRFDKFSFPGVGSWRYRTRSWNGHVFDFYVKPAESPT